MKAPLFTLGDDAVQVPFITCLPLVIAAAARKPGATRHPVPDYIRF